MMASSIIYNRPPSYIGILRVMIFIDGGYVRKRLCDDFGHDDISHNDFVRLVMDAFESQPLYHDLIRVHYYDAIVPENETEFQQQRKYFDKIRGDTFCELRLGNLKKDGKGHFRQKGVDTLIAIDMLSKAYENHYDVAILVAGDEDIHEVVRAVKNAGKRVYGVYFEGHVAEELRQSFDFTYRCSMGILETHLHIKKINFLRVLI
jgi:uncharacterized LabA/DUF88 family protein